MEKKKYEYYAQIPSDIVGRVSRGEGGKYGRVVRGVDELMAALILRMSIT